MRILLSIFVFAFTMAAQADFACKGQFQLTDTAGKTTIQEIELATEYEDPNLIKVSGDIGEYHFMVRGNKLSQEYLMMITLGPYYQNGVTAATTWNASGSMRVARVDGNNVYRVLCQKQPN
ncbi:MAG: hypothetical protein KDD33_11910 [Bdellovibrionales bacterium]|nr:hypothetical protein [Bdellovibrionales bacterium]